MPTFERYDVAAAPFPYVERPVYRRRPCVVIASIPDTGLVWVLMITSADNQSWLADEPIGDLVAAGLRAASVVWTAKIATVEAEALKKVGRLDPATALRVAERIQGFLQS